VCAGNRGVAGGAETYLRSVLPRLSHLGFRLAFVFEKDATGTPSIDEGVALEKTFQLTSENRDSVLAAIDGWRPNVVFNNGMYDADCEMQLTRYPVVYFAHNYVGTCLNGFKRHAWPTPEPCYRTLGLACLAYYIPRRCGGLSPLPLVKNYLSARRQQAMLRACRKLQVASEAMRAEYLRHGFAHDKIVLNPLFPAGSHPDPSRPQPRAMSGLVLLAGRLTQIKGGEYLVKAMALARQKVHGDCQLQLAVAGEGPELAHLRALAEKLAVPAHFHGWLTADALKTLMRKSDLLAMPSLWPEPFGLLGPEAGCVGLPSVGYAHGGIPDWLVEGKSGTLAPSPPTVEGLAEAIVRALSNADRHHDLRVGAWEMAQRFSADRHMDQLDSVLRSAADMTSINESDTLVALPGQASAVL